MLVDSASTAHRFGLIGDCAVTLLDALITSARRLPSSSPAVRSFNIGPSVLPGGTVDHAAPASRAPCSPFGRMILLAGGSVAPWLLCSPRLVPGGWCCGSLPRPGARSQIWAQASRGWCGIRRRSRFASLRPRSPASDTMISAVNGFGPAETDLEGDLEGNANLIEQLKPAG